MKSVTVVACAAVLVGCGDNKPSKADVDAYRSAQTAAQERLRAWQKDFDRAIAEVQEGTWVPRPDLGACVTNLPTPRPGSDEGIDTAFFLENDDWSNVTSSLVLAQRHDSERSARANLVAAGPPPAR